MIHKKLIKLIDATWWRQKYCHFILHCSLDTPIDIMRIEGHLSKLEAKFLYRLSRKLRKGSTIVEIGSYKGKSTVALLSGADGKDIKVHVVDTWTHEPCPNDSSEDTYSEFSRNIAAYSDAIVVHRGLSKDIAKTWTGDIDLLFIDGDHSYEGVSNDISGWLPYVKRGGWMVFHDSGAPGVSKAIKEHFPRARRTGMPFYAWSIFAQRVK